MSRAASAWAELRSQWQVNTRLRVGTWVIVAIIWVYALLLAGDAVEGLRKNSLAIADEIDRLRPLTRGNPWPGRVDEARQQITALQAMAWAEVGAGDIGLVEAALQDWVRATAAKAGLRVRELVLSRASAVAGDANPAAGARPARAAGGQPVRLRLSVEWGRAELLAFLAEVGRSERVVVVDRLVLRPAATPAGAEIDLRVWASARAATSGSAATPGASR